MLSVNLFMHLGMRMWCSSRLVVGRNKMTLLKHHRSSSQTSKGEKKMWKTWWKLDISVCFVFRAVQSDEETAGGVCLSSRAETVDQSGVSISHRAQ